jgi:hypothetical protein
MSEKQFQIRCQKRGLSRMAIVWRTAGHEQEFALEKR